MRKFEFIHDSWLKVGTTKQSSELSTYKKVFVKKGTVINVENEIHNAPNGHLECKVIFNIYGDHFKEIHEELDLLVLLRKAFPRGNESLYVDLKNTMDSFEISKTKERAIHFLTQVGHESAGLYYMEEIASGDAYEGRRDLGNIHPGDGRKFKGSTPLQLTGRANYKQFADFVGDPKVMEIGAKYVIRNYPTLPSGYWWHKNNMNKLCDEGATVKQITRKVNGGYNGLADRWAWYDKINKLWQTLA